MIWICSKLSDQVITVRGRGVFLFERSGWNPGSGRKENNIILMNLEDKTTEIITAGGAGEGSPRLSPDGKQVAFISSVEGKGRQLWLKDLVSGTLRQLTSLKSPPFDPLWSPDGTMIVFCLSSKGDIPEENTLREGPEAPVVITDFGYKFDGIGFHKPEHIHLWVAEVQSAGVRRITDGPFDYLHPAWWPDSTRVICVSSRFRDKKDSIAADLVTSEALGQRKITQFTRKGWAVSYPNPVRPVFTPDGRYIVIGISGRKVLR